MTRRIMCLAGNNRGASVIELALVLPFFAVLVLGIADISRAYSAKLQLTQSAYRGIEKVQQYQANSSTYSTLQTEAAAAAGVPTSNVAIDFWLECDGTRQTNYNSTCSTGQRYGRWVTIDVTKKYTPMFASTHWPGANSDGTYTLHGQAGLRTQ